MKPHIKFKLNKSYNFINTSAFSFTGKVIAIDTLRGYVTFEIDGLTDGKKRLYVLSVCCFIDSPLFDEDYVIIKDVKPQGLSNVSDFICKASMNI